MKILVMGTGSYYQKKKAGIQGDIIAFVDNYKRGTYEDKEIISPSDINKYNYDKIYIMSVHFISMGYQLLDLGVSSEKICFGVNIEPYNAFENNFISDDKQIIINNDKKICYHTPDIEIAVNTHDEMSNIREIYGEYSYHFSYGNSDRKCVVMDIGANIAGASIYFAQLPYVDAVYAYEPFDETIQMARYNIKNNHEAVKKVELISCGLGTKSEKKIIEYNPDMTCGLSTVEDISERAFNRYREWGMLNDDKSKKCEVTIRDICLEIKEIIKNYPNDILVVKMDCEGAEYDLIEKMHFDGLLKKVSVIMLEWHYNGSVMIEERLKEDNFTWFSFGKSDTLGTIYAVNNNKEGIRRD